MCVCVCVCVFYLCYFKNIYFLVQRYAMHYCTVLISNCLNNNNNSWSVCLILFFYNFRIGVRTAENLMKVATVDVVQVTGVRPV